MAPQTLRVLATATLASSLVAAGSFDRAVARRITVEDLVRRRDAGEKPIMVDARGTPRDVTIRGAVHVPGDRVEAWATGVRKDALIVAYCA
jgi:hypothetical protein